MRKRRSFSRDAGGSIRSGDNPSATIVDTSPAAQLHRALSNRKLYEKQDINSKSELDDLIHGLTSAGSGDLVAFATGARDLMDHFIPMSKETPVKQKAFGALCGILKVTILRISRVCRGTDVLSRNVGNSTGRL